MTTTLFPESGDEYIRVSKRTCELTSSIVPQGHHSTVRPCALLRLHEMPLIATIVGGLGLAFVFEAIAHQSYSSSRVSILRLSNNSMRMRSVRDTLMMRGFIDGQSPFDLKRPAGNEVDVRKDKTFSFQEAGTQLG
jgi:hypothetical protein